MTSASSASHKASEKTKRTLPKSVNLDKPVPAHDQAMPSLVLLEERAALPGSLALRQQNLLKLQRTIGNKAIQRTIIQREDAPAAEEATEEGDAESKAKEVKREEFQKGVSTPIPADAVIGDGEATMSVGNADVTILPDKSTTKKKYKNRAVTSGGITDWGTPGYKLDDDGKVESFDTVKTPKVKIQTVYGPGTKASDESGYGRGTTEADKKAGNTSLGFHEGMHGKTTIDWLKANPLPKFEGTIGMTEDEFKTAMDDYVKKMLDADTKLQAHQISTVDCVGDKADFCEVKEETGEEGGAHEH